MNGMSFSETIFLFLLALVVFGPKKLPEIARQIGKYLNEFKRASNEFRSQIEQEIAHLEVEKEKQTILPPSAPVEGTESRSPGSDSYSGKELATSNETPASETPADAEAGRLRDIRQDSGATLAASVEHPAGEGSNGSQPGVATEAAPSEVASEVSAEEVTSSTSQGSHA